MWGVLTPLGLLSFLQRVFDRIGERRALGVLKEIKAGTDNTLSQLSCFFANFILGPAVNYTNTASLPCWIRVEELCCMYISDIEEIWCQFAIWAFSL